MTNIQRFLRRLFLALDAGFNRLYGSRWNPIYRAGQLAAAMLVVLLITGLYLVLFYRVGDPAGSVERIAADPWLGSWIRSLHRYATDLFVVAVLIHALRMLARDRSWGPRTLAWFSGLFLLSAGLACAWTGFVMAWDSFGGRLALEGARMFDVLPLFSEPLSRIFAGNEPVPNAFFFVNLFLHITIPLLIGVGAWLHVSRMARPALLPPRKIALGVIAALIVVAVVVPARLGPAADPLLLPDRTPVNLFAAWWLPLAEQMPAGAAWLVLLGLVAVPLLVPRLTRKPRIGSNAVSVVDPRFCTGCNQCPQDCPWEAITMVERDDDRPTLLAQVDPDLCVSCGICAGSCAPMGIGPAGRDGRSQLSDLRESLLPELVAAEQRSMVAVCCSQTPGSQRRLLADRGARIHEVSCAGNLHSSVVEMLIRNGATGVMVATCAGRDCTSREGPQWLHERLYNEREAELQERVDRRRVKVITMAPGESKNVIEAHREFLAELEELDLPQPEAEPEIELECDTELMQVGVEG